MTSNYGKRGGTSKNAGKKKSTYRAIIGGRTFEKSTFSTNDAEATMLLTKDLGLTIAVYPSMNLPAWALAQLDREEIVAVKASIVVVKLEKMLGKMFKA